MGSPQQRIPPSKESRSRQIRNPKRKKTKTYPRLSCKIEYLLTSNHTDGSIASEFFTGDNLSILAHREMNCFRLRSMSYSGQVADARNEGAELRRRRSLTPVAAGDFGGGNHGLRPAFDAELLQDRRDMRLDGRLRHAELIGDLLVEQTLRQHHQHPHL